MRLCFLTILLAFSSLAAAAQVSDRRETTEPDSPLIILYKPRASYPNGMVCVQGTVTLRVTFGFDGTIRRITTIKGLPHGLTERSIEAARQMQFLPEIRDGYHISTIQPVSFSFSIH
ncbi:MAG TPA: energy transducer TonB [Pyrinomonadaceae bacterium]